MWVTSAFFFLLFWKVTFWGINGTGFHAPDALSVIQAAESKH